MASVIFQVISWPAFVIALVIFGFAPGAVLRLIVLLFRRDDPRRRELLGELYAVPRIERPFWVIEQLELALFEGLRGRFARRVPGDLAGASESVNYYEAIKDQLALSREAVSTMADMIADQTGVRAELPWELRGGTQPARAGEVTSPGAGRKELANGPHDSRAQAPMPASVFATRIELVLAVSEMALVEIARLLTAAGVPPA